MLSSLILASKSIARKQVLEEKGINIVKILPSNINEVIKYPNNLERSIEEIARLKLEEVMFDSDYPILACDTLVALDNQIFGKAKDKEDAKRMLTTLNGRTHKIISGFALYLPTLKITITGYDVVKIKFNKVSMDTLNNYLDFIDYKNCAGSYRIQNLPKEFDVKFFGDYYTAVGLPFSKIFGIVKQLSDRQ